MPRNGSGVAYKPAGTTAVTGTVIESAKYNSTIDDIYALLNEPTPIVAGGTGATSASAARTNLAVPGTETVNTFTATQKWAKGADVASASTLTLGDDGNYFDITGTTTITAIASKGVGTVVKLHFDGALTLTHNATDLVLPGGVSIRTAAGDEAEFVEYASGDWRCTNFQPAVTGYQTIISQPFGGAASITITDIGAFRLLRFSGSLHGTSVTQSIVVKLSSNNGSSFFSGATDYSRTILFRSNSTNGGAENATPGLELISSVASGQRGSFEATLSDFNVAGEKFMSGTASAVDALGNSVQVTGGRALNNAAVACNAIQLLPTAGTALNGYIHIEGVRA